jgi:hypothetical protein
MIGPNGLHDLLRVLRFLVIIGAFLTVATTARTQDVALKEPEDPKAKAAFGVLSKHCARCHQAGRLIDRQKPAKDFGNILQLDEIATNPARIVLGNPFGSPMIKKIVNKEMPQDYWELGTTPNNTGYPLEDEVEVLKAWINDIGTKVVASCETRKFIPNREVVNYIISDLDRLSPTKRKGTRYLTLVNLYNACTNEKDLGIYRQSAIKLVNSLARLSNIVTLETIDPTQTILRINIDDLGWDAADWETVLSVYPYATRPADSSLNAAIEGATYTKLAYVRADWFAFTASRPPLYNALLKLPKTFQELQKQQRVDIIGDINKLTAKRAGFQKSGVSEFNRLIERHPSPSGYFWTSYDFGSNDSRKSLFEFPLGPGGDFGFVHDGGETIFSLPNGFQGYYLSNAKGEQLDKGPINIVRDNERARDGRDPSVINGFSCMSCHAYGINKNTDEIREHVLSGRGAFPKKVRDAVAELHPPVDEMNRILDSDGSSFRNSMKRAGIETEVSNGVELIATLSKRYEENLDLKEAAAEFGLSKQDFETAVSSSAEKANRLIVRRLEQSAVPRDQFEKNFIVLSREISDDEIITAGGYPAPISVAKVAAAGLDLSLTSDKDAYPQGNFAIFTVVSSRDCYLTLTDVDQKDAATVLFPNKFSQSNLIRAGAPFRLPDNNAYQYRMKDKGVETVTAVCTDQNVEVDGIQHDFSRSAYTTVPNYTRSITRSISIEASRRSIGIEPTASPQSQSASAKPSAPDHKRDAIGRTAIKIHVD